MSSTDHGANRKNRTEEHHEQGDWLGGVREGYADLGEVQLHYVEAGNGPLVVLLHGFPEFWYGWRPLRSSSGGKVMPTSDRNWPSLTMTTFRASSVSSGCRTPRTGFITTRRSESTSC
jgi:hypothetical protein